MNPHSPTNFTNFTNLLRFLVAQGLPHRHDIYHPLWKIGHSTLPDIEPHV